MLPQPRKRGGMKAGGDVVEVRDRRAREMNAERIAMAGGGAAGFFAAIACAQARPANEVTIFERSSQFLSKVRISGGGRCNVTHAALEPRTFSSR